MPIRPIGMLLSTSPRGPPRAGRSAHSQGRGCFMFTFSSQWRLRLLVAFGALALSRSAAAQSFGVELNNTLMPASGAMAGASIALPQDLTSGLNANPATLTQFQGTQFLFGGAWAEPTFNVEQTA